MIKPNKKTPKSKPDPPILKLTYKPRENCKVFALDNIFKDGRPKDKSCKLDCDLTDKVCRICFDGPGRVPTEEEKITEYIEELQ